MNPGVGCLASLLFLLYKICDCYLLFLCALSVPFDTLGCKKFSVHG